MTEAEWVEPNWKALEQRLGIKPCGGFMFTGRVNGINPYNHGIARMYLNLDDPCYVGMGPISKVPSAVSAANPRPATLLISGRSPSLTARPSLF